MKLMFLTAGSRGDVEPFAALAGHAASAGHEVYLGVPDNSGVELPPVSLVPLDVNFSQLVADQGVSPVAAAKAFRTVIRPAMGRMLGAAVCAVRDVRPDVVVYHPKLLTAAAAASSVGAAAIVVETVPTLTPTRAFPMPGTVSRSLGPFNRVTYRAGTVAAALFRRETAQALRALGPRTLERFPVPVASLVPVSPVLLERPSDWPATTTITGAWVGEGDEAPLDESIAAFISQGPFVYAGFGSMATGDPIARARVVIGAARSRGLRVLLATGWGGLELPAGERGDDVLAVGSVPHSRVLPSAAAAIHHGGAGTAHAVVRAGVPSVVVPFIADQPFWARQLEARGLASAPVPARGLSVPRLERALEGAAELISQARAAASAMAAERGTARALEIIEAARA